MAEEKAGSFHYGGQAVLEGVMMRGKKHFAVACRRANGEITASCEPIEGGILGKLKWLNRPFLRGTLMLADSLVLGMKSLMWSANIAMSDELARQDAEKPAKETTAKGGKINDIALGATMFVSMGIAIVLFMMLPAFLTKLILSQEGTSSAWRGLLEGGIKLLFLFLYIWGISHWKEIRRFFEYHGAEHKVINAFESGVDLTVDNIQRHTTVHVRCGTSFLLVVVFVSVLVFMPLPWQSWVVRAAYKLLFLPVVAGIAYEIIKLAGGRKESKFMRLLLAPGLLMQRITTQEPSDDQVEVALKSFLCVREAEEKESGGAAVAVEEKTISADA